MKLTISVKKRNFREIKLNLDLVNWHRKLEITSSWLTPSSHFLNHPPLPPPHSIKRSYKVSKNPFKDVHLDAKIDWISLASLWNSTTLINAIVGMSSKKILCGCSFRSKNLLNFTVLTMKFHNCHYANEDIFNMFADLSVLLKPRHFTSHHGSGKSQKNSLQLEPRLQFVIIPPLLSLICGRLVQK